MWRILLITYQNFYHITFSDLLHNEINDEDSSEDEGIISKFVIENFDTNVNTIIQPENNADNNIKTKRKCTDIPVLTKWAIVARYMEGTNPKTNRLYQGFYTRSVLLHISNW